MAKHLLAIGHGGGDSFAAPPPTFMVTWQNGSRDPMVWFGGDYCKTLITRVTGGGLKCKVAHLSPRPLDLDPTSLIRVSIVCTATLVCT
jgi:hypothetical protein